MTPTALSPTARRPCRFARTTGSVLVAVSEQITLEIHDDGRGIGKPTRASGLANMATRADRHGGVRHVTDEPGGGTTVRWVVPLTVPPPDRAPPVP